VEFVIMAMCAAKIAIFFGLQNKKGEIYAHFVAFGACFLIKKAKKHLN